MAADGKLVMEDAKVIFRNFAGKEGMYNREGDRNFCVLLDEDTALAMLEDGWNVKRLKDRDTHEPQDPYLQVSVSFRNKPPTIVMITSKGRSFLDESMVELIDWIDIKTVDLIVSPYQWAVSGKTGVKAYLSSFYVTVDEDFLALKYSSVPEIGAAPTHAAIEGRPHADFEGEVVE